MADKVPSTSELVAGSGVVEVEIEKLGPQQHAEAEVKFVGLSKIPSTSENRPPPKEMLATVVGAVPNASNSVFVLKFWPPTL